MTEDVATSADTEPTGWSRRLASIRVRLVGWFVLVLAVASATSILVVRQVLLLRIDEGIDRDLVQETRELRVLATGNDPTTGDPFGDDVRRIFRTFLDRNIPSRNEALLTFVDGELFRRSRAVVPYRLDHDAELVQRWAHLETTERSAVSTPAGTVEVLAVPIETGGDTGGVFVVAIFRDLERRETEVAIFGVAATGLIVLLIGSLLAWRLADRLLTPINAVSDAARSISESDLSRRIDVVGRDEIAHLAATFNAMLDRLEEAFATQKQFLDDASHELRTPITIVRGHLETLEADPADRARTVALVTDELDRMARMVDDLLVLARSERPDFLDLRIVDAATLTEEVHGKATAIADRRWSLAQVAPGRIVADRHRITQALVQLAQNAAQHTDRDDDIEIGSRAVDDHIHFWVRDTGAGVAPSDGARIFERFARGRGRRAEADSDGTGLGLAIVDAIARAHHGEVRLDSAAGRGTTFTLVLPIDQPEDVDTMNAP